MARLRNPLAKIRKIIAVWPETDERLSHGSPTFWGGKKTFASFHDNHHGDGRQPRLDRSLVLSQRSNRAER